MLAFSASLFADEALWLALWLRRPEARRRIALWCGSFSMKMPAPPRVAAMHDMTTLTPFYNEEVVIGRSDLVRKTANDMSILFCEKTRDLP